MRSLGQTLVLFPLLMALVACNGSGGGGGAPTPLILTTASLDDTSWTLVSVEGAPGSVSGSWQFRGDGSYTFSFAAGFQSIQGVGTFDFDGTFLRFDGVVRQIVSDGVVVLLGQSATQFTFADEDDDLWVFRGAFGATAQPSGVCVPVQQGAWEFDLEIAGMPVFTFVDGALTQSGCVLSYDEDAVFVGLLAGAQWTVNAPKAGIRFVGTFTGSPARQFAGTWTDINGRSERIVGRYVGS